MARLIFPIILLLFGLVYLIFTLNLPKSNIGDPNSPMYFPLLIASLLIVMSAIYFIQELRKRSENFTLCTITRTCNVAKNYFHDCLRPSLCTAFEPLGFLISTILFFRSCVIFN